MVINMILNFHLSLSSFWVKPWFCNLTTLFLGGALKTRIWSEFRITPVNSGYYTLQIYPRVYVNMFRVKPRATLGLIFFTVLIQNSDKQWKVLSGCLKKLPSGIPSGHQTFPRGCAPRESLMTLGNSLGQLFPDNHCGLSTVYTRPQGLGSCKSYYRQITAGKVDNKVADLRL